MPLDDIFIDMSVSAIIADTEGLNRSTVDAIKRIGADPDLKGVHMMGGLSNIGQQLPPKAVDGSDLKHAWRCAFLTLTVPHGFDYRARHAVARLRSRWPTTTTCCTTYQNFLEQKRQQRAARGAQVLQGLSCGHAERLRRLSSASWFDGERHHPARPRCASSDGLVADIAEGDHGHGAGGAGAAGRARRAS